MQSTTAAAPPTTGMSFLLVLCLILAIVDLFYWKKGGARTPKKTVRKFQYVLLGFVVFSVVGVMTGFGAAAGDVLGISLDFVFIAWECTRYKVRRDNPIAYRIPPPPPPLA
ncbi:hypothetical protein [Tunturiibacter lichenicola]|uniref:hypothetical protein n=1 Tax=Tunturiibacter lichenicola TaxID=2051959 RepID=UPI0021B4B707|nr:hypothetical protein [Edaphobacter lichenicola]